MEDILTSSRAVLQGQKPELAPATPEHRVRRPQQGSAESSSGYSEPTFMHQLHKSQVYHRPEPVTLLQESPAYAPDTPYRLRPAQAQWSRNSTEMHHERASQQTCAGCSKWQCRYALLQQQRDVHTAESAQSMRTEISMLTQRLSEAQHDAASLAADLAQSQRACAHMQRQLSSQHAKCLTEQQHAVIPLGEYLDLSRDTLLCTEAIRAMSLGSSDSASIRSHESLMRRHTSPSKDQAKASAPLDLAEPMHVPDARLPSTATCTPELGRSYTQGHGSRTSALAHQNGVAAGFRHRSDPHQQAKPVYEHEARLHSIAASVAESEGSRCSSGRICRDTADVDSMLQALEDVLQSPTTPNAVVKSCLCLPSEFICANPGASQYLQCTQFCSPMQGISQSKCCILQQLTR